MLPTTLKSKFLNLRNWKQSDNTNFPFSFRLSVENRNGVNKMGKDYDRYQIIIEVTGELHPDIHFLYGELRELLAKNFKDTLPKITLYEPTRRIRSDVIE